MAKRTKTFSGEHTFPDEPNWTPLERLIGYDLCEWFMWMGEVVLSDGRRLQAYKHFATRDYFHLADDRSAFVFTSRGRYQPIGRKQAVDLVFGRWRDLKPQPYDWEWTEAAIQVARGEPGRDDPERKHPGELREEGLERMCEALAAEGGGEGPTPTLIRVSPPALDALPDAVGDTTHAGEQQ